MPAATPLTWEQYRWGLLLAAVAAVHVAFQIPQLRLVELIPLNTCAQQDSNNKLKSHTARRMFGCWRELTWKIVKATLYTCTSQLVAKQWCIKKSMTQNSTASIVKSILSKLLQYDSSFYFNVRMKSKRINSKHEKVLSWMTCARSILFCRWHYIHW